MRRGRVLEPDRGSVLRFHVDHRERHAAPARTAVHLLGDVDTLGTGASGVVTPMHALQLIAA